MRTCFSRCENSQSCNTLRQNEIRDQHTDDRRQVLAFLETWFICDTEDTAELGVKTGLFSKWHWDSWVSITKTWKLSPLHLTSHTKINVRQITVLDMKNKTIKFLQENIKECLYKLGVDKNFLKKIQNPVPIKDS